MKKLPFNFEKFFWAFCKATRYISEPVTNMAGNRLVTVHTYDKDTASTLKTMLTHAFDVKVIMSNTIYQTEFMIKY